MRYREAAIDELERQAPRISRWGVALVLGLAGIGGAATAVGSKIASSMEANWDIKIWSQDPHPGDQTTTIPSAIVVPSGAGVTASGGTSPSLNWFCDWYRSAMDSTVTSALGGFAYNPSATGYNECFRNYTQYNQRTVVKPVADTDRCAGDWPAGMDKVLELVIGDGYGHTSMVANDFVVDTLPIGWSQFWRYYTCDDFDMGSIPHNTHWWHIGGNGSNNYGGREYIHDGTAVHPDTTYSSAVDINFSNLAFDNGPGTGIFWAGNDFPRILKAWRVLRHELRYTRGASGAAVDSFYVNYIVYDSDNNVVADRTDFFCTSGPCYDNGGSGAGYGDILGDYPVYGAEDWNKLRSMELGNNNADGDGQQPAEGNTQYWYVGGFAIRQSADSTDRIGPYPVGPEVH